MPCSSGCCHAHKCQRLYWPTAAFLLAAAALLGDAVSVSSFARSEGGRRESNAPPPIQIPVHEDSMWDGFIGSTCGFLESVERVMRSEQLELPPSEAKKWSVACSEAMDPAEFEYLPVGSVLAKSMQSTLRVSDKAGQLIGEVDLDSGGEDVSLRRFGRTLYAGTFETDLEYARFKDRLLAEARYAFMLSTGLAPGRWAIAYSEELGHTNLIRRVPLPIPAKAWEMKTFTIPAIRGEFDRLCEEDTDLCAEASKPEVSAAMKEKEVYAAFARYKTFQEMYQRHASAFDQAAKQFWAEQEEKGMTEKDKDNVKHDIAPLLDQIFAKSWKHVAILRAEPG